jgi:zinc/manganese transport system substrate-binding protein/manganese/iron transport system substrate-binding protein
VLASALVLGGSAACGGDDGGATSAGELLVVATTTQTADFARVVGGGRVRVVDVVQPGVDPHDFEASPADLESLRKARVIVRNGVGLEPWLDDALAASDADGTVVDASAGIAIRGLDDADHGGADHSDADADHGEGDPHIWQDPRNAKRMVATIAGALSTADADGAAEYAANRATYEAELDALDAEIAAALGSLPNPKLVTDHDAFGYYVDRYGLTFVGSIIPTFESSAELSAADVTDLVARIKAEGVKAVFAESTLPPKTAEAIGREAGVRVVAGEDALYGDSLGSAGSDAATYLQMMRHNTRVIVDNLR